MRRRPQCPTCPSHLGQRHAAYCRLVATTVRTLHPYVTDLDVEREPCGCSTLLVAQHGDDGHRADCGQPSAPRPPARVPLAALPAAGLLVWAAGWWLLELVDRAAGADAWYDWLGVAAMLVPALGAPAAIAALVRSYRAADWHGRRVHDHCEPGRLVTCHTCHGDGLLFTFAYPPAGPTPAAGCDRTAA